MRGQNFAFVNAGYYLAIERTNLAPGKTQVMLNPKNSATAWIVSAEEIAAWEDEGEILKHLHNFEQGPWALYNPRRLQGEIVNPKERLRIVQTACQRFPEAPGLGSVAEYRDLRGEPKPYTVIKGPTKLGDAHIWVEPRWGLLYREAGERLVRIGHWNHGLHRRDQLYMMVGNGLLPDPSEKPRSGVYNVDDKETKEVVNLAAFFARQVVGACGFYSKDNEEDW